MQVLDFGLGWRSDFAIIVLFKYKDEIGGFFEVIGLLDGSSGQVLSETHLNELSDKLCSLWLQLRIHFFRFCFRLAIVDSRLHLEAWSGLSCFDWLARGLNCLSDFSLGLASTLLGSNTAIFFHRLQFRSSLN